jgi:hypothetical protein
MKVEDTLLRKITEIAGKREIGTVRVWGGKAWRGTGGTGYLAKMGRVWGSPKPLSTTSTTLHCKSLQDSPRRPNTT